MNTPSAVLPAACSGCGWEAARNTGGARLIHGRCALAPPRVAGAPFNSVLMNVTPSANSLARDFGNPTFLVPLCPAPMPSTARPFETWSSEAIAAALTAGCRVSRLVTQSATRALGELLAKIEGVGPEEETNLHLPLSTRHRLIEAAHSLRLFAETAA